MIVLPSINEAYADYVLSISKNGLDDMVRSIKVDKEKDIIVADLQPSLIEKFTRKFPEAELSELDVVVEWILIKTQLIQKEKEKEDVK